MEPDRFPANALELLSRTWEIRHWPEIPKKDLSEVEGIFCRLGMNLNDSFLDNFESLQWIASPTTSLTHIDLDYVAQRGIELYSARDIPDSLAKVTSTAELTVYLTLAISRNFHLIARDFDESRNWNRYDHPATQLSQRRVGVLGAGRIGSRVLRSLEGLGCDVRVYDRDESIQSISTNHSNSVEQLVQESDVLIVCISSNSENFGFIDRRLLSMLPRGACVVNTARGEVIDEKSLAELIEKEHINGYATDVLSGEPKAQFLRESPIIQSKNKGFNILITPHVGGAATDAMASVESDLAVFVQDARLRPA